MTQPQGQPVQPMEAIPQVVANCKILSKLGQGGMGAVFRAVHTTLGRNIALKVLPIEFTRSPEYVARFMREARAVANLNHANVVGVHDAGEQGGIYYIAMELVDGASMGALTRHYKPLSDVECLNFLAQSAKGLGAAHKRGLIHRDIKPENMLVTEDGTLKIVDFGLVLEQTSDSHLTRTGTFLGTPVYMSPEQCDGDVADARSDLYSLGATFYGLVTGKPPFSAPTALGILYKHKFEAPADPRTVVPELSAHTGSILLKCLQKKREDRYQNCQELLADIQKAQAATASKANNWKYDDALAAARAKTPKEQPVTFASAGPLPNAAYTPALTPNPMARHSMTPAPASGTSSGMPPATMMPTPHGYEPPLGTPSHSPQLRQGATAPSTSFDATQIGPGTTPAPLPLQEMHTPAGANQTARPNKGVVLLGAAAGVLLLLGVGGYFAFDALQKKNKRESFYVNVAALLNESKHPDAYREVSSGLRAFPEDEKLLGYRNEIAGYYQKSAAEALKSDLSNAAKLLKVAYGVLGDEETLKSVRAKVIDQYKHEIGKDINDNRAAEAQKKADEAVDAFPEDKSLERLQNKTFMMQQEGRKGTQAKYDELMVKALAFEQDQPLESIKILRAAEILNFRVDDVQRKIAALQDGVFKSSWQSAETLAAQDKVDEAVSKLEELKSLKLREDEIKLKIQDLQYKRYMKASELAEKNNQWETALYNAEKAAEFGLADERVQMLGRRGKVAAKRKEADRVRDEGDWRVAAEKLEAAGALADPEKDHDLKLQLLVEAKKLRESRFAQEIGSAEAAQDWPAATQVLEEALRILGDNNNYQERLTKAKDEYKKSSDFQGSMKAGQKFLKDGAWPNARASFQNALSSEPNNAEAKGLFALTDAHVKVEEGNKLFDGQDYSNAGLQFDLALTVLKGFASAEHLKLAAETQKKMEKVQGVIKHISESAQAAEQLAASSKFAEAIAAYEDLKIRDKRNEGAYEKKVNVLNGEKLFSQDVSEGEKLAQNNKFAEARAAYVKAGLRKEKDAATQKDILSRIGAVNLLENLAQGLMQARNKRWQESLARYADAHKAYPEASAELKHKVDEAAKQASKAVEEIKIKLGDAQRRSAAATEQELKSASALYTELQTLDPWNKEAYAKGNDAVLAKLVSLNKDASVRAEQEQAGLKKRQDFETALRKAEDALARDTPNDFDIGTSAANLALSFQIDDAKVNALLGRISAAKKDYAVRQASSAAQAEVKGTTQSIAALVQKGSYQAALTAAQTAAQKRPATREYGEMVAALTQIKDASATVSQAEATLTAACGTANITSGAKSILQRAKTDVGTSLAGAVRTFSDSKFNDAGSAARGAGTTARTVAKEAIESAARSCQTEARSAAGSGGGSATKRPIAVGEEDLPTPGGGGAKGDPKKAALYNTAAQELLKVGQGL